MTESNKDSFRSKFKSTLKEIRYAPGNEHLDDNTVAALTCEQLGLVSLGNRLSSEWHHSVTIEVKELIHETLAA